MKHKLLHQLGLTENETEVYLAFLEHKETTAAEIARALHMDKSSCYRAVESLVEKGLLITTPRLRGTTHGAVSPLVLKELHLAKKAELKKEEVLLDDFIRKLMRKHDSSRSTYIKMEKGIQAVRDSMDFSLEAAVKKDKLIKERYRLDYPYFENAEHVAWVNEFARRRIKAGVAIRQMVNFAGKSVFAPIMKSDRSLLKEVRLMPDSMKDMQALRIAGDTATIISFDKNNDYIVIRIRDPFVTELLESFFDFVWDRCEKFI